MRPAVSSRLLVCAALALALGGCTHALKNKGPNPPESTDCSMSAAPEILLQSRTVYVQEADRTLAYYEKAMSENGDSRYVTLIQLARLCFVTGQLGEKSESERRFLKGRSYAEILCREQPDRVEGHYWLALNSACLAEIEGAGAALRSLSGIVEQLEKAQAIDETYDQAGVHRVLGRICCKAPCWPLSEGDMAKSLQHLQAAVELAPGNSTNHLHLAETLMELGEITAARQELKRVLSSTQHAIWPCGFVDDQRQAVRLIQECEESAGSPTPRQNNAPTTGGQCLPKQ